MEALQPVSNALSVSGSQLLMEVFFDFVNCVRGLGVLREGLAVVANVLELFDVRYYLAFVIKLTDKIVLVCIKVVKNKILPVGDRRD